MTRKAIRNRWRFLKQSIFRSLFRSQLTRFSVSRRRMRIESLEDRRLLALSPISVPEAAALRDTAAAIGGFSARLEDLGAFAKKLPLQETSIGDFVNIDAAFAESFITPSGPNGNRVVSLFPGALGYVTENVTSLNILDTTALWTNPRNALDVNEDIFISPLDVLVLINDLNFLGPRKLPTDPAGGVIPPPYLDVDSDGFVSPLDVLIAYGAKSRTMVWRAVFR